MLNLLIEQVNVGIEDLFNPARLIEIGGFWLLVLIVFAETGLFFGFFLPGDALLFSAGLLTATGGLDVDVWTLLIGINLAAILGNMTGYAFGKQVGPRLFSRNDGIFFRKEYILYSQEFYEKYGGPALILGRFLPVVRTFAPILAGVARINYIKFLWYNLIGSLAWSVTMAGSGYFLANRFPWVREKLEWIIIGLIVVTMIPLVRTFIKQRRKKIQSKS